MKTKKTFLFYILLGAITLVSCSKNDDYSDPVGTIPLNMMNENNGKTILGNSDIYINKDNNFYGASCVMNNLGTQKGVGSISSPELRGLSNQLAVEEGNAYQVFTDASIRKFPSGKLALKITADYYNVYVVSQIMNSDTVAVGFKVKYSLLDVPEYGLPEYNSEIGTLDKGIASELTINLSASDFEYEFDDDYNGLIQAEKDGNKLILRLEMSVYNDHNFGIYIRKSEGYTYVRGKIKGTL